MQVGRLILASCAAAALLAGVARAEAPPTEDMPLPAIAGPSQQSRVDPLYSRIASALTKKPTEVRCWNHDDWKVITAGSITRGAWGFVRNAAPRINLHPATCYILDDAVYRRTWPTSGRNLSDLAKAVSTIGHEAQHVKGNADERAAECFGLQLVRVVARALGFSPARATRLTSVAWQRYVAAAPRTYRSPACRDGGALDLRPGSSVWP